MEDDNRSVGTAEPTQTIDVRTPIETPIIPTVEAAGDPPIQEEAPPADSPMAEPAQNNFPAETTSADAAAPAPMEAPHKAGAPIAAITAAILVALGLAAVTVYAYMKSQNENKPAATTTTQSASQTAASEVDKTTKEIDNTLSSTSEATDFPANEISDQSLGL